MDSLTHIVLGACIGEVCIGKHLGKKALLLGAAAQSLPDLDIVAGLWLSPAQDLLAHRGFTHSLLFAALATLLLALTAERWHRYKHPTLSLQLWVTFFMFEILAHIFLDAFNAYGTGWFEPFSHYRVSFNTLFVADPLFTIWPAISLALLVLLHSSSRYRCRWATAGLVLSSLYLVSSVINKINIQKASTSALKAQSISHTRLFITPTPMNTLLWYIVAESDSGFYIGHRSVFDTQEISFHYVPRNGSLLKKMSAQKELSYLLRFSEGYYVVSNYRGKLVFNDLRFGQMAGWQHPDAPFVFYYYLDYPKDNTLLIQRGRFEGWNRDTVYYFLNRMLGKTYFPLSYTGLH